MSRSMPRREHADALALAVGRRIRALRVSAGLTMEKLAYESALGSKGHLSNIEKGLVRPTIHTLKAVADHLGVLPLDLLTFPDDDLRQALIDQTRHLPAPALQKLRREAERLAASGTLTSLPLAAEPKPEYGEPPAPQPTQPKPAPAPARSPRPRTRKGPPG